MIGFGFLDELLQRKYFHGKRNWERERPLALWRGGKELSSFGVDSKGSHHFFIAANVLEVPALVLCEFLRRRHWRAQRTKHLRSLCVCACERERERERLVIFSGTERQTILKFEQNCHLDWASQEREFHIAII